MAEGPSAAGRGLHRERALTWPWMSPKHLMGAESCSSVDSDSSTSCAASHSAMISLDESTKVSSAPGCHEPGRSSRLTTLRSMPLSDGCRLSTA